MSLDKMDIRILEELQKDGRLTNQKLAELVGLSPSPCWRRVKRLEEGGVIDRFVTLLNAEPLGLQVTAFLMVSLEDHHPDTVAHFDELVSGLPQIQECYATSGMADYLLKIVISSMREYEELLIGNLLQVTGVRTANTSFVLKERKRTTALPLPTR
ncbi:MAG: Lrp/AsnC family transcriptional regulator [Gammaproteobacteria bacterium]|nr:Lrp/AsnC family transcriptional regulator [Gammaproteobacteria bacterium]